MVELKSERERVAMRAAGQVVGEVLQVLKARIEPGLPTLELDRVARDEIRKRGGEPVFLGYQPSPRMPPYPATVCVSVNDEVIHGVPGSRRLRAGDLVSLDLGARVDGFVGDAALSVAVGEAGDEAAKLLAVTEDALWAGLRAIQVGGHIGDIGAAVQAVVEAAGFGVVREFVGHGVGRSMHESPEVPNYGTAGRGTRIQAGMALAVEPMVTAGDWHLTIRPDGWTAATLDGRWAAHFEHTVFVGQDGVEVLTASPPIVLNAVQ